MQEIKLEVSEDSDNSTTNLIKEIKLEELKDSDNFTDNVKKEIKLEGSENYADNLKKEIKLEKLEDSDSSTDNLSDEEGDCDVGDIEGFNKCNLITEEQATSKKRYILQVAATLEHTPNIGISSSNRTCQVFHLSNNKFAKLATFSEFTDRISDIKFSEDNNNLLYACSNDGSIRLWDLRTLEKPALRLNDATVKYENKQKSLNCFDISPNNRLLAAGTNLFEGDAFILFWDIRKSSLLGGYWESHTDDITQVKFHSTDSNKLISGSVDGLINLYDLAQTREDDALTDCLNTESSVEKLEWIRSNNSDAISCITHTAGVQFWKLDDARPYLNLNRSKIAEGIRRDSYNTYITNVHQSTNFPIILAGSNSGGKYFRALSVDSNNSLQPLAHFNENKQIVRSSWFNRHTGLLLTGGEKGILNAWSFNQWMM